MQPFDLVLLAARRDSEGQAMLEEAVSHADAATLSASLAESATHRCTPALADAIRRSRAADPRNRALSMDLYYMYRTRHIQFSREYRTLISSIRELDDSVVVLKGILLDSLLYTSGRGRLYIDLDVLARDEKARSAVTEALTRRGYAQAELDMDKWTLTPFDATRAAGYHEELQHAPEYSRLDSDTGNAYRVDVHHRLSTVFDHIEIAVEKLDTREYDTPAGRLLGLAPDDMFAHLAYHAWWDTQSIANILKGRDLRLYQFTDMHLLLSKGLVAPGTLVARAKTIGAGQVVNWALSVLGHLWQPGLLSSGAVDEGAAIDFDSKVSDRWVQRSTAEPIARWQQPAWERMRDGSRGDKIARQFFSDYVDRHTKLGHILTWSRAGES